MNLPTGREPHQTCEPRGLSPSGGKPPAKLHVSRAPRAQRARSEAQGVTPCQTCEPRGLSTSGGKPPAKLHVSRAAPRPMARSEVQGVTPCQTGEPRGLSPSGGNFTATRHVSRAPPRPKGAEWGQGALPLVRRCLEPSWRRRLSGNRRCSRRRRSSWACRRIPSRLRRTWRRCWP